DKISITTAVITTISGPFVGVGFSLMAVQYTGAGIASTLMAITPIIIILPSYWLFHQPITLKGVIGALISVIGVSLFFLA
ncbi:MAG: EamA family transporter, partial [Prevotella sp.]|nr:EamA family transporter [Prevotella sp.]